MCKHENTKALLLTLNGDNLYYCNKCKKMFLPSRRKPIKELILLNLILIAVYLIISH